MGLSINDTAPDFEAETTQGKIKFHDWIGDSWAVLFSHPKDFTPICTTELGYMAKIQPEFEKRGVKIIGLSVDATGDHERWAKDIEETQGAKPQYPIIADSDFHVAKLYGMLPADTSGDAKSRTPADNQTVRNVFVIGPDKKIKLVLVYPMTTGRNFDEVLRPVVIGYTRISLIFLSGPITNTLRTVWLSAGVRSFGFPEALAGSISYSFDTDRSPSLMSG